MKLLRRFFDPAPHSAAHALYSAIVGQARQRAFYDELGVPDTPDGRFDMIALHAILVLRRLRRQPGETGVLAQTLFDLMFADMDQNLREMGVGDLSVGKRIKAMAQAFYGRLAAYDRAIASHREQSVIDVLERNLFRKTAPQPTQLRAMAAYAIREAAALAAQPTERLLAGMVCFGPPSHANDGKPS